MTWEPSERAREEFLLLAGACTYAEARVLVGQIEEEYVLANELGDLYHDLYGEPGE